MSLLESVFRKLTPDKRRARRLDSPPLVAFYWDGNTPNAHPIQNVSMDGFYLVTAERMRPGTVITMTIQRAATKGDDSGSLPHITVMSRVVWQGEDGVGFAFIPQEPKHHDHEKELGGRPAGSRAIGKFLEQIKSDGGHMMIQSGPGIPKQPPSRPIADPARPKAKLMRRFADESGQALVMSALAMTCLLGFCALAADVGIMLREKRLCQSAADSAAVAGALQVNLAPGNVSTAATLAASQNGFTSAGGATITVNGPPGGPLYGPHAGQANAVEVIISQSQPTLFMGLFGFLSMSPTARAVAVNGGSSSTNCVLVNSKTAARAMDLQGSFTVTAPNCGVVVNSSDPDALHFTGGGGTLSAGSVGVVGGDGGQIGDSTPTPVKGIVPVSDPLGHLDSSFPTPTGCIAGGTLTGTPAAGCYSGDASGNLTMSNVTLSGMYVFSGTGTLTFGGSVTSGAAGSTIDLVSGSMTENSGTTFNIAAPTDLTNTFHGIAIMAPASNTSTLTFEFGNSSGTVDGIIYAPGANLFLHDSGGDHSGGLTLITDLIVGTLKDQTATLNIQSYSQSNPSVSPLTKVTLVE
jgi:Flp pilus assembly protein TadG